MQISHGVIMLSYILLTEVTLVVTPVLRVCYIKKIIRSVPQLGWMGTSVVAHRWNWVVRLLANSAGHI